MAQIIDITGTIQEGMWHYDPPFPDIHIRPVPPISWLDDKSYGAEIFEGLHSLTGTYVETPAHMYGNGNSYSLLEVPLEKLVDVPCVVLNLGMWDLDETIGRRPILPEDLARCPGADLIKEGDAILVGTGYGRYWFHPQNLACAPYFTKGAMAWLLAKKPSILGADSARWENLEHPEDIFDDFYAANILMAGPFVRLEEVKEGRCSLTVLPLKVAGTSCAPARAFIRQEE